MYSVLANMLLAVLGGVLIELLYDYKAECLNKYICFPYNYLFTSLLLDLKQYKSLVFI